MIELSQLAIHVEQHPFPLMFATVSGAHLYGFPSEDSDYDLRGIHLLPLADVVGLGAVRETVEKEGVYDGIEIDLVTHDIHKFFGLMLKKNGYVLEQVFSPLVVHETPEYEELRDIATRCVTRHHVHHYLGFAATQWKLFQKDSSQRVKPLLYVFRVLLTGIHLMQTGQVQADLGKLNESARLSCIDDLIRQKLEGSEKVTLKNPELHFYQNEYTRLVNELKKASEISTLPEVSGARAELNDLLIRLRLRMQN
jgi:uncharacterized protein